MDLEKNLRQILMKLRTDKLIEEKVLLSQLEKFEKITKQNIALPSPPLLAVLQTVDQNQLITELNAKMEELEGKIESIISSWESNRISDDEARGKISSLVELKQFYGLQREGLNKFVMERLNFLTSIIKDSGQSFHDFFFSEYDENALGIEPEVKNTFLEIWMKHQVADYDPKKSSDNLLVSEIIESDILKAFILPISEENQVKFHLEDIIKPFPEIIDQKPLFRAPVEQSIKPEESMQTESPSSQIPPGDSNLWRSVGLLAFNTENKPIGLIRAPIQVRNVQYLPIVLEESLSFMDIKSRYLSSLYDLGIDLNTTSTEKIQKRIATALKIPLQLSFQPSFFNEWLNLLSPDLMPLKPKIANVWFYKTNTVHITSENLIIIDDADLEKITLPAWIPASSPHPSFPVSKGMIIKGIAGTYFGEISGILSETPFGHSLLVERDIPPSSLLDIFIQGLGKQNLAELRFYLAKQLKVGEGEVFSPDNLWKINFQERLLRSPHEIAISYYSIVPSCAFFMAPVLRAKIGIYFNSISESLRFLIGKSLYKNDTHFGTIYGFKVEDNQLFVLYSPLSADQLVQQVGRKHSHQHVDRFRKRISLALAVPENESLWPNNLAVYYLNFIFPMREEFNLLPNTMAEIEAKFALKLISFSEFDSITEEGLFCR